MQRAIYDDKINKIIRDVFRTQSDIYDEDFLQK